MNGNIRMRRHVGLYRALLILYPREFRHEYGGAMVQLFTDQLRHGSEGPRTNRLWFRTIRDLFKSAGFERLEVVMSSARSMMWVALAMLAAAGAFMVRIGGIDTDHPGPMLITLAIVLAIEGGIIALAYLYRRLALRPTESGWQRSPLRHWWTALSGLIAVVYLIMGTMQFVDEPTSGHAVALSVFAAFAGLIVSGLLFRTKRTGSLGTWLVAMGVLPGVGTFWFPPFAIACLLALIGAIAEAMGGGAQHRVRLPVERVPS